MKLHRLLPFVCVAAAIAATGASFIGAWNGDLLQTAAGYAAAVLLVILSVTDFRPGLETAKIVIAFTMVLTGRIGRWAEAGKWVVGREAGVVFFRRVG